MLSGLRSRLWDAHQSGVATLFLAVSINAFGAGMFVPFALLYYQAATSLSAGAIGVALTAATLVTLVVTPVTGALVDRFGARPLVVLSQGVEAVGFIGYLAVSSSWSLFGAALVATAGTRMFYASFSTLIAESAVGAERDRWYGFVGITQSAGASLSGLLASVLISSLGLTGFRVIITGTACCLIASALLIRTGHRRRERPPEAGASDGYRHVLRDRAFLRLVLSNTAFILYSMLIGVGFAVYVTAALGAPLWSVGFTGVLQTGLVVGLQTRVTGVLSAVRRTRAMLVAGGLWVLTCLLLVGGTWIPASLIVPYLAAVATIFTLGQLCYVPASRALAAELAPPECRGRHVALFELSYGMAAAMAPAAFGVTYDYADVAPWLGVSVLLMAAMVLLRQAEMMIPITRNRPNLVGGVT